MTSTNPAEPLPSLGPHFKVRSWRDLKAKLFEWGAAERQRRGLWDYPVIEDDTLPQGVLDFVSSRERRRFVLTGPAKLVAFLAERSGRTEER